jgi:hypothetical protein
MKHRGWKAIAERCDCSMRKAQQLAYHPVAGERPLPVRKGPLGVELDEAELEVWLRGDAPTSAAADTHAARLQKLHEALRELVEDVIIGQASTKKCRERELSDHPRSAA